VSERRPLLRRPDTMARPARVRMRRRKPCTLARRRLFGWNVRLPLATAISPQCVRPLPSRTCEHVRLEAVAVRTLRWSRLLAPARKPDDPSRSRIATFGRLFEGTDEISLGQTCLLRSDRHPDFVTSFPPVTIETDARQPVLAMLQNCWHPAINLLASAKAISDRDGAGRRSEDGRQPRAHGDSSTVTSPGHAASARESNDTTTGVGYSQTVDNHVDTRSLSIRPTLSGLEGELLR